MITVLTWRRPDPPIITRWRGPTGRTAVTAAANPPTPVATIIGPPGVAGPAGPTPDLTAAVLDGGTFN